MNSISRNAPCPCGSGRKYKNCCIGRHEEATTELGRLAHRYLEEEGMTREAIFTWMERRFGSEWATPTLEILLAGEELDAANEHFLVPWFTYLYPFDGATPAARYAAERGPKLTDVERRTIEVRGVARTSLWEVRRTEPGVGLELFDLLVQETRFVHDVTASRGAQRWTVMLAAIAEYPEVCVFNGVHERVLMPDDGAIAVREARRMLRLRTRPARPKSLAAPEFQAELFQLWNALLLVHATSPLPRLENTDGDPLLLCTDYFDVEAGAEDEVLRRLSAIEGGDLRDSDGEPVVYFLRDAAAAFATFERTEVARARFLEKRLIVETNSLRRADLFLARVAEALEGLARHRTRKAVDPRTIVEQMPEEESPEEEADEELDEESESDPGLHAAMLEMIDRHYAAWPDTPLPAFDGLTPREAASTTRGREELVQLLKQMEVMEGRKDERDRYDFDKIRRALGIEVAAKR